MKNKRYNLLLIVGVTLLALWSLVPTWKEYSLGKQLEAFSSPRDSLNFVLNHRDEIEDARQKGLKLGLD